MYPPKQRVELKWVAVDFDGTIAHSSWTPDHPNVLPGKPMPKVDEKLAAIVDAGFKVVIHTSRPWSDYELIESYMTHHMLPFHNIVCGKLLAAVYVDDRARHASDWDWTP